MIRRPPRSTLFPYTTSSDLEEEFLRDQAPVRPHAAERPVQHQEQGEAGDDVEEKGEDGGVALIPDHLQDRKSTRLNSSHGYISYAVFCLKKKTRRKKSISKK